MYEFYTIHRICKKIGNLSFYKRFESDNVQGSCGLLLIKKNIHDSIKNDVDCREIICEYKTDKVFYKYGNNGYNCTISRLEYIIAQDLLDTCSHLPNFMRPIVYLKNHFVRTDKCMDPFSIERISDKNKLSCVDVAIFEFIQESYTLQSFLKRKDLTKKLLNSIIMQVSLAIIAAQQNAKFVHNDLHSNNVLLIRCDKNLKILYRINICEKERLFLVPTYGFIPVIIDYGFSYSKECENMSLECVDSDNYGLITYKFDSISDFIRFFIVICCGVNSGVYPELLNKIQRMFSKLPISMTSSWEKIEDKNSLYEIEKIYYKAYEDVYGQYKKKTKIYAGQILRLIMRNILLPINYDEKYKNINLTQELVTFFNEWSQLEKWLKYDYERIYVIREFLDSIRKYTDKDMIVRNINQTLKDITSQNIPLNINWNLLINSVKQSVGGIQNIIYDKINILTEKRDKILYSVLISGENMFLSILKYINNNSKQEKICENDVILLIDNISKNNLVINIEHDSDIYLHDLFGVFKDL